MIAEKNKYEIGDVQTSIEIGDKWSFDKLKNFLKSVEKNGEIFYADIFEAYEKTEPYYDYDSGRKFGWWHLDGQETKNKYNNVKHYLKDGKMVLDGDIDSDDYIIFVNTIPPMILSLLAYISNACEGAELVVSEGYLLSAWCHKTDKPFPTATVNVVSSFSNNGCFLIGINNEEADYDEDEHSEEDLPLPYLQKKEEISASYLHVFNLEGWLNE